MDEQKTATPEEATPEVKVEEKPKAKKKNKWEERRTNTPCRYDKLCSCPPNKNRKKNNDETLH